MPISEMKQGATSSKKTSVGWETIYQEISHMQVTSKEALDSGMSGFVSLGIRGVEAGPLDGEGMVVLKTCGSETEFSTNTCSGDNGRSSGWFVAMNRAEALGLAKRLIELAQKVE